MRVATVNSDWITAIHDGDIIVEGGIPIPNDLLGIPATRLRFDGIGIIDATLNTNWVIDQLGRKHLPGAVADEDWPEIECSLNDELINENGNWRIKTDADNLAQAKSTALENIVELANKFTAPILAKYPDAETAGWSKKETECELIIAAADSAFSIQDALAKTMIMKALANAAGWDDTAVEATARAVMDKVADFADIAAMVEVMREQSIATINAAENIDDLETAKAQLLESAAVLAQQYGLA